MIRQQQVLTRRSRGRRYAFRVLLAAIVAVAATSLVFRSGWFPVEPPRPLGDRNPGRADARLSGDGAPQSTSSDLSAGVAPLASTTEAQSTPPFTREAYIRATLEAWDDLQLCASDPAFASGGGAGSCALLDRRIEDLQRSGYDAEATRSGLLCTAGDVAAVAVSMRRAQSPLDARHAASVSADMTRCRIWLEQAE